MAQRKTTEFLPENIFFFKFQENFPQMLHQTPYVSPLSELHHVLQPKSVQEALGRTVLSQHKAGPRPVKYVVVKRVRT